VRSTLGAAQTVKRLHANLKLASHGAPPPNVDLSDPARALPAPPRGASVPITPAPAVNPWATADNAPAPPSAPAPALATKPIPTPTLSATATASPAPAPACMAAAPQPYTYWDTPEDTPPAQPYVHAKESVAAAPSAGPPSAYRPPSSSAVAAAPPDSFAPMAYRPDPAADAATAAATAAAAAAAAHVTQLAHAMITMRAELTALGSMRAELTSLGGMRAELASLSATVHRTVRHATRSSVAGVRQLHRIQSLTTTLHCCGSSRH
jgi:hypothetical protein